MHFPINRRIHRFSAKYKYTKWDLTQPIRICISDQRESTDPKCVHCLWLLWRWMLKVVLRSKQWADSLVILICECRKVEQTCIRATEDSEWAGRGGTLYWVESNELATYQRLRYMRSKFSYWKHPGSPDLYNLMKTTYLFLMNNVIMS